MAKKAYEKQSISLKEVQKIGPALESAVRDFLGWEKGRVVYYSNPKESLLYDLDVDACFPNITSPEIFVSATYCNPDKPGHSNENKLQLKLGELLLLKSRYPNIKAVLVIGGTKQAWLPYVLKAFEFFYDKTLFTWDKDFDKKLNEIKENPKNIDLKHQDTWKKLSDEWKNIELYKGKPIVSNFRKNIWLLTKEIGCEGSHPSSIKNQIIRYCMQAAYDCSIRTRARSGSEWTNYMNGNWNKLWESRSYFNPVEATIELLLINSGYAYSGKLAQDAEVPSLIHYLGGKEVDNTKVSEDFVLFSQKLNLPVFIQSKSTGGGMEGHGKNIQNRTKEQLARSLFYRGSIDNKGNIVLREKDFFWISVLDGDWGVTKKTPLKYIHMLQWAGYDFLIGADELVDDKFNIKYKSNKLTAILSVSVK